MLSNSLDVEQRQYKERPIGVFLGAKGDDMSTLPPAGVRV